MTQFEFEGVRTVLTSASVLVMAAILSAAPAHAQADDISDQSAPLAERITVTAQKREESIQDVPIAITAFTDEALGLARIENAQDIQFAIPNAILVGNDRFTLRGIGNNALSSTADNGVGVLFNTSAIGFSPQNEFYDLERIEVLRGPQGTLYGRNTTGGAINVITKKPTDEFEGYLYGQYGNFESYRVEGGINIPITDNLRQRISGYYLSRDGFTENVFTGNDIDDRSQFGLRSTTALDIGEDTSITLTVDYYEEDSSRARENKRLCRADAVLGCSPDRLGFDSPDAGTTVFQSLLAGFFTGSIFPAGASIYDGAPNPRDLRQVAADTDPEFIADALLATLEISHSFGDFTVTSLTGYAESESEGNTDYDNAALPFRFTVPVTYNASRDRTVTTDRLLTTDSFTAANQTWTQELRLVSETGGAFDFTLGAFYLNSLGRSAFEIWHPALEFAAQAFGLPEASWRFNGESPRATTEAWALFGEAYYRFDDQTKLTVGARYTDEEKSIKTRNILLAPPPPFVEAERSWDEFTGKIAIDHAADLSFTDETLLYGYIARGYKGGGLNPGNSQMPDFDPEFVNAIEVGSKNTLLGGTLVANVAGFYYDYEGLQLAQRIDATAITQNADATIWGLEGEFLWSPIQAFLMDATLSYLNTEIDSFLTVDAANPAQSLTATAPEVAVDLQGNELPHAPEFSFKIGAQYTVPVVETGWSAALRGQYYYQDAYFAREFNTPTDEIEGWSVIDVMLTAFNPDETIEVQLFVKNLADEDNITNIIIEDAAVGRYRNARILEPRTFGVGVVVDF